MDKAVRAIREIEQITCEDIAAILNVLASKMKAAGFSELELDVIDEANGFICGETA